MLYFKVNEYVTHKIFELKLIRTKDQWADVLAKPLPAALFTPAINTLLYNDHENFESP
jgi:hypothetical protein